MTPKEKAQELVDKFLPPVRWKMGQEDVTERAKQCALIALDEIFSNNTDESKHDYWIEVKQELEKL